MTDDSDLEALLAAPLERWRVFPHPSQRKLVERDWNGPVKVTGGAGTGKTVVAMHRAARLARQYAQMPGRPVLFTTFTKTLAEDIRQHLELLCTPQELEKIQVVNLDQWASGLLRRFGYPHGLLYSESDRRRFWQAAMAAMPAAIDLSTQFMRAEYERVVLPQGCETADDYMRASRVGRGGIWGGPCVKHCGPCSLSIVLSCRQQIFVNLRRHSERLASSCARRNRRLEFARWLLMRPRTSAALPLS